MGCDSGCAGRSDRRDQVAAHPAARTCGADGRARRDPGGAGVRARPAVLSWSTGKDCAKAFEAVCKDPALDIVALLTTFNEDARRVAIHGTARDVARAQAAALGLPLVEVDLPDPCPNAVYEARIGAAVRPQ